ncbi:hypothetical protein ES707_12704 [subsurface metagenome]
MPNLKDRLKKGMRRCGRKLALILVIYVAGFVTAAYWAVSPATDTADAASSTVQTQENQTFPESVGQAAHKSVEYAGDAARRTGRLITGQSDEDEDEVEQ